MRPITIGQVFGYIPVRIEALYLARLQIEPMKSPEADVVRPYFAIQVLGTRHDHRDLRHIVVQFFGETKSLKLLRLLVELRDTCLQHHAEPEVSILITL